MVSPFVAWRHQAITWTNVDLSSVRSCGILRRSLSWEDVKIPISKIRFKITFLESHSDLPRTNELSAIFRLHVWHWLQYHRGSMVSQIIGNMGLFTLKLDWWTPLTEGQWWNGFRFMMPCFLFTFHSNVDWLTCLRKCCRRTLGLNLLMPYPWHWCASDWKWVLYTVYTEPVLNHILTHWGRGKMAAIFQTTFSNAFSWMEMYRFWLKFHWSLLPWV